MGWHSLCCDCAVGQTVQDLNLIRNKRLFLLPNVQNSSGAQPASGSKDTGVFLAVKQLAPDIDYSPPSSLEAKNEWNFTSTPCCMP